MFSRGGTVGGFRAPEFSVPKFQDEARSLARERNPEMFWEGVLQLGRRLEATQDHEAAAQLYHQVVQSEKDHGASTSLRHRAQLQLNALDGSGPSIYRSEILLRHLARETCEPSTLIGMTAASTAFRLTRLATLSGLAGSPTANLATRGFGARILSGLLGFGVEATVFPLATRGAAALLGKNVSWDSVSVTRDLASSFLVLGGMKLVGSVAGLGRPPLPVPLPRGERGLLSGLLRQAGMLGGIMLGHKLEVAAGLRAPADGATAFFDSLAMLVQVNAAGRLSQGLLGPRF